MTRRLLMSLVASACVLAAGCDSGTPTSPTATPVEAVAPPTYAISGVVSRPTAAGVLPVGRARVELLNQCRAGHCPQFAMTDAEGRYLLNSVPAGAAVILASKWGYETLSSSVTVAAEVALDLTMVRNPTYTLSGVTWELTADGLAPVENVTVYCDACGEDGHTLAYTDADGAYSFPEVYAGVLDVLILKDGYVPLNSVRTLSNGMAVFPVGVTGNTHLDIQLSRR